MIEPGMASEKSPWEPRIPVIPPHWLQIDFDQAFASVSVNRCKVPAKEYAPSGLLPVIDQGQHFIGGYTDDLSKAINPGNGVIVFGDHTRIFKRVAFPFAAGADGIKVLRPLVTDARFAYYACLSLQFPNKGYSRHYSFLGRCKFPVPPLKEQQRIVSKIDKLFSEIDEGEQALKRVRKLVERYRQSVLKAAVTGELTRAWREKHRDRLESGQALLARILKGRREAWEATEQEKMKAKGQNPSNHNWKRKYKEPVAPATTRLSELPQGWTWATLDQLSSKITSGSRDWKEYYGRGTGVFVMAQNVRKQKLDWREIQLVDVPRDDRDAKRSEVAQNDLLITIVGANTGDACRVSQPVVNHYVCQSVALVRPIDERTACFLELFLAAEEGAQRQFNKVIYGAGRPHLSFDNLREIHIPVTSIEEQAAIADIVSLMESDVGRVEEAIRLSMARAAALRQATLQCAFSGKLTPQNLTDEPASVLLQRITAEREASQKKIATKSPRAKSTRA